MNKQKVDFITLSKDLHVKHGSLLQEHGCGGQLQQEEGVGGQLQQEHGG